MNSEDTRFKMKVIAIAVAGSVIVALATVVFLQNQQIGNALTKIETQSQSIQTLTTELGKTAEEHKVLRDDMEKKIGELSEDNEKLKAALSAATAHVESCAVAPPPAKAVKKRR